MHAHTGSALSKKIAQTLVRVKGETLKKSASATRLQLNIALGVCDMFVFKQDKVHERRDLPVKSQQRLFGLFFHTLAAKKTSVRRKRINTSHIFL
jgi:hypothetical protein